MICVYRERVWKQNIFVWFVQFLKNLDKSKFLLLALLFKYSFLIKIQLSMSEPEKKQERIYDSLNA